VLSITDRYRSLSCFPTSLFLGFTEAPFFWSGVGCSAFRFLRFSASSCTPGLPPIWRDCSFFFTKVTSRIAVNYWRQKAACEGTADQSLGSQRERHYGPLRYTLPRRGRRLNRRTLRCRLLNWDKTFVAIWLSGTCAAGVLLSSQTT
jgi:hypothetical protein